MTTENKTPEKYKAINYEPLLGVVTCPNRCFIGQVKYYPNPERALFEMRTCACCKGEGEVTVETAEQIEAIL